MRWFLTGRLVTLFPRNVCAKCLPRIQTRGTQLASHGQMATGRLDIDEAYDLPPRARRELELFVHRCMRRLEADATLEAWCVSLTAPTQASFRCAIEIKHHGRTLQKHGDGSDVVVAAWNAICGIEAALLAEAVRSPRSS